MAERSFVLRLSHDSREAGAPEPASAQAMRSGDDREGGEKILAASCRSKLNRDVLEVGYEVCIGATVLRVWLWCARMAM